MLFSSLVLQCAASFLVGGLFVLASTFLAEKTSSNLGGVIGGLPSTSAVSLLFIAISSGPSIAVLVASTLPLMIGFCGLFLLAYASLSFRFSPNSSLFIALVFWLMISFPAGHFAPLSLFNSLSLTLLILLFCIWVLARKLKLPVAIGEKLSLSFTQLVSRGAIAGTIISASVMAAKLGGPALGSIFAGFPAVFFATMFTAVRARGVAFSRCLITPLIYSGLINISIYALAVAWSYPRLGIAWGTLSSYSISLFSAYFVYRGVRRFTAESVLWCEEGLSSMRKSGTT